ncbi:MAG TPA: GAF domain-containing protein, partial [Anaerolineae bacterium]|nr:GAF domain-containing protein [Anaerolineae bacterium]
VILVALIALLAPLILTTRTFIVGRLHEITQVEGRANRLLLLASTRVESSRVNLLRYLQDYAPSAYEALDDVEQASQLLTEAQSLTTSPAQKEAIGTVLIALDEYKGLIQEIEDARSAGQEQQTSRLLFQASRLGNDIGSRIEQIVANSERGVAEANRQFLARLQNRMLFVLVIYGLILVLSLVLSIVVERSITRPIAELTERADAFRRGDLDATVPVVGSDELTLLAKTFNEMIAQIRDLIGNLERRVAERTQDLADRAVQMATAAEVGRAAASILDPDTLAHRVVDLVQERFGLYYVGLFLTDPEGEYALLQAGSGAAGQAMEAQGYRLQVGGDSMVGQACALRRPRIALNVGQAVSEDRPDVEIIRFDNPLLPETQAELALPLIVGDRVLGALDVQATQPDAFAEDQIEVLQLVADQVAVAVQNARLFDEIETMLQAERQMYGQISREAWTRLIRRYPVRGYYGDDRGIVPLGSDGSPPGPDAAPHRPDAETEDGSVVAVPIVVRDQVIGVIDARKPPDGGEWTEREAALLEMLVGQLGAALDSARLYEDTQRRAARDRLLSEVASRVRETLDIETVLRTAAVEIRRALELPEVVVRLAEQPPETPAEGDRHA